MFFKQLLLVIAAATAVLAVPIAQAPAAVRKSRPEAVYIAIICLPCR